MPMILSQTQSQPILHKKYSLTMLKTQFLRLTALRLSANQSVRHFAPILRVDPKQCQLQYQQPGRMFSTSPITHAKKVPKSKAGKGKKGKGNSKEVEEEEDIEEFEPKVVLKELEEKFKGCLEEFQETCKLIKMGNSNPKVFDQLKIKLAGNEEVNFNEVAQMTSKGKRMLVTVYEPNNVKRVISSILAMEKNLIPKVDPKNEQVLVIETGSTDSVVSQRQKDLKKAYDNYKTNHSSKVSLVKIRGDAIRESKSYKGPKDLLTKLSADIHAMHNVYADKMQEVFKKAAT
ncbi:hypothetical protein CANARDRAFT_6954 [[Candida] arabinofermentans NRRL YB-2248]|uniref:Ribosome-recycling factor, mitochondrial n=1 Tax=[Candida] arabinofermentans NRRL YB-2248 TaxID=983967 RepID=A0A1E4T407_9ASCO|nr:hypothetical protein CANARDRAFT_6954 [[Candida] arabinofermentans NRRL YB-2248]